MGKLLDIPETKLQAHFAAQGWTDGLPVVPPTPEAVTAMLATIGDPDPESLIGIVPGRSLPVTAEAVAVNAVMAGCLPAYFPIVWAAVEAILDPAFNVMTVCASTGGAALAVVVSGPVAQHIGMGSRHNALGTGNRANATIGRALRLIAINVLGAKTSIGDASSIGNPGKYSLCFAEEEPPSPWDPLRVALGFGRDDTLVTVLPTEGPRQVANHLNEDPEGILLTFAATMRDPATFVTGKGGQGTVVLGHEHRQAVIGGGWTRRMVQEFLFERSHVRLSELEDAGVFLPGEDVPSDDRPLPSMASPDDIFLVTAGGAGSGWSAYLPGWAPKQLAHAQAVSRLVRPAGEDPPACGVACEVALPEEFLGTGGL